MKTVHDMLRTRLLAKAGFIDSPAKPSLPSLERLRESEWSPRFEELMRNRLLMGAFRYGLLNAPGKKKWDRMARIHEEVQLYQETGNLEYLVDVANYCLLEFEESTHPNKHFRAADDESHCRPL